jgi:hypothetical protein
MDVSLLFAKTLKEASCYRNFLDLWRGVGGKNGSPLSYGEAALRIGFKSRAFLSDVIQGRKGLTQKSLNSFLECFQTLPPEANRLFENLVYLEHSELRPAKLSFQQIEARISKLRSRLDRLLQIETKPDSQVSLVTSPQFHICYAALGSLNSGVTLGQVQQKTGLNKDQTERILQQMVENDFCEVIETTPLKYAAKDSHRVVEVLSNHPVFKEFVSTWLENLLSSLQTQKILQGDLYNVSTFSILKKNQPELRKKLTAAIDTVIENFEEPDGDAVSTLTVVFKTLG